MRLLLCFIFLFSFFTVNSQRMVLSEPDRFILSLKIKVETEADLISLIDKIRQEFKTDAERVRAAYYWVTENIAYDVKGLESGDMTFDAIDVIKKKKAVCAGYTDLMNYFFRKLGLEYEYVKGVARVWASDFFLEPGKMQTDHAWNAVKIDNQWKLIDATWASGYVNSNGFTKKREDEYYLADPYFFIYQHLPDDTRWQLLKDTVITEETFCNWPLVTSDFLKAGISITPFYKKITGEEGQSVEFRFTSTREINQVYLSEEDGTLKKTWEVKPENGVYIISFIPSAGTKKFYLGFGYSGEGRGEVSWSAYQALGYLLIAKPASAPDHDILKGPSLPGK